MADIYGQLVKAQFENSASDLSNVAGIAYYNTSSGLLKYYDAVGTAWRTLATTATAITDVTTTRGDLIRRGASILERFTAVTDNRVVRGDGTDVIIGQIDDPDFFTTGAAASGSVIGIVTTSAQNFAGVKTFNDGIKVDDAGGQSTLNFYEEGTFVVTWAFSGGNGNAAASITTGWYQRVNKRVHFHLFLRLVKGTGGTLSSGTLTLGGIPYNSANTSGNGAVFATHGDGVTIPSNQQFVATLGANSGTILLQFMGATTTSLGPSSMAASVDFLVAGSYLTA